MSHANRQAAQKRGWAFFAALRLRRAWPLLPLAAICASLAPVLFLLGGSRPLAAHLIPFSGMSFVWLVYILLAPHWKAARRWKAQLFLWQPATVWFNADGICIRGADSSLSAGWKTILSAWETRDLFVFYYAPRPPGQPSRESPYRSARAAPYRGAPALSEGYRWLCPLPHLRPTWPARPKSCRSRGNTFRTVIPA